MKRLLVLFLLALQAGADTGFAPFGTPSNEISKISDLIQQFQKSVGELPPEIRRVAVYQIKADPKEVRLGTIRYIQAQVEDVLSKEAHRAVVNSPELRNLRVVSTDTSLTVSNSLPSLEDLSRLALKLDVDAFVEGACTRSADNDLMLTIRIFRSRTGELVWTGNFVSGPNRRDAAFQDLDFAVSVPFLMLPVDAFNTRDKSTAGTTLVTTFAGAVTVSEPMTPDHKLTFSLTAGYSHLALIGATDTTSAPGINMVTLGVEILGVFFRKQDPRDGYWLGTYLGYQESIPLKQSQHFGSLRFGYRTKPTRHFSLGFGVMVHAYGYNLADAPDLGSESFDMNRVGYEINFLHYTF